MKNEKMFSELEPLARQFRRDGHRPESLKDFVIYADADELYALANSFVKVDGVIKIFSEPAIYQALLKGAFDEIERFDGLDRPFYVWNKKDRRELSYDEYRLFGRIARDYACVEKTRSCRIMRLQCHRRSSIMHIR